MHKYLLAFAN